MNKIKQYDIVTEGKHGELYQVTSIIEKPDGRVMGYLSGLEGCDEGWEDMSKCKRATASVISDRVKYHQSVADAIRKATCRLPKDRIDYLHRKLGKKIDILK